MNNLYVPCGQQNNQHDPSSTQPRTFRSAFRRPSSQYIKSSDLKALRADGAHLRSAERPSCYEQRSSTSPPSLGSSSPSSLEDETSPKTPASQENISSQYVAQHATEFKHGDDAYVGQWKQDHTVNDHFTPAGQPAQSLPCRSKYVDIQAQQPIIVDSQVTGVAPPIILETPIRSRLARDPQRDVQYLQGLQQNLTGKAPTAAVTFNSRCHARRRPRAESRSVAPPKLRRDTDCTDAIVRLIVCLSTKLVHAIWSQSNAALKTSSSFNDAGVLPLRVFIQETLRRSKTSYSTLQIALYYLIQLKPHVQSYHSAQGQGMPTCRALQCGRRMFLTALILASKYIQDRNYSSRAWSKISGLPIAEINENERRYLGLIQFNLHMKKETFENWSKVTLTLCKVGETGMATSTTNLSDSIRTGSDAWWSYQLNRLTTDLVQDTKQMDEYIISLTASSGNDNFTSEQMVAPLDTPPSSPDDTGVPVTEKNLMSMLAESNSEQSSCQKTVDYSLSPSSIASLPSRPNLPNLPTPLTTPRHNHVLPWPKGLCQYNTRCSASSQALLNLDKQAMNVANLESCPPPKPRPYDLARASTFPAKRGPSSLSSLAMSSITCSPESAMSDTSSGTTRSRSSSISSTSSLWFASGRHNLSDETTRKTAINARPESELQITASMSVPAPYGFYHYGDGAIRSSNPGLARFLDEGYGTDDKSAIDNLMLQKPNSQSLSDMVVDVTKMSFPAVMPHHSASTTLGQLPLRRNKRAHSSTRDANLHNNIRQLVWGGQPNIDVVDAAVSTCQDVSKDKQVQFPEKEWADLKRPVTTTSYYNKRIAMQYRSQLMYNPASEQASQHLRDVDLVRS